MMTMTMTMLICYRYRGNVRNFNLYTYLDLAKCFLYSINIYCYKTFSVIALFCSIISKRKV